ncbi:hypothetical protein QTJ16_004263 [Diplocarpon rosae]|uniref:PHD and RING finger domain-containing protein n=1 Tax=Diplocarpon rosae TaxID=946125 RepID=A0AAD9SYB7_9HELO|nr:hypothetical protein QTJ16_004263 [Diplocarpon rosae]PBP22918.1 hypothetical protein BUE80_DR006214 [Diplocarpon rosae]
MADQCIVCLEDLDAVPDLAFHDDLRDAAQTALQPISHPSTTTNNLAIALIKPCGHILHDECLREWSQQANSCPICRHAFNLVEVLDKVGGSILTEYEVEDKKQVAEFDLNAWVAENEEEEEESRPCPICGSADQEEVLLLCDSCDAPYHTHCTGLDRVPNGHWFCMECTDQGAYESVASAASGLQFSGRIAPRTQASARRTRMRVRNDHWFGAWSLVSSRIHDVAGLDLDFSDDDQALNTYRQTQRRTANERREFGQYQRRLRIATRQGARDIFRAAAPPRLQQPPTPVETTEETRAWGAFEKAKELDSDSTCRRKRKSRSVTASPREGPSVPAEPERKLKRPRTRRTLDRPEASVLPSMASSSRAANASRHGSPTARIMNDTSGQPSFLSSLLKEVETNHTSDDERLPFSSMINSAPKRATSPPLEFSSPGASPASSSPYHTPRAMSITPPPHPSSRSRSPPLTSRVEPTFPPANYSPNRYPPEKRSEDRPLELRQPRPRRRTIRLPRSEDTSPTRAVMSIEAKEGINRIVKTALAPHWKAAELTKEQYADINRDISRKLYEIAAEQRVHDESGNELGKIASTEVANAVRLLAA